MARQANLTNDKAVRALKWVEGEPAQFMVRDSDRERKGFYIRISKGGARSWVYQYRKKVWFQWIVATQALNLSAGVSKSRVFLGRSFSSLATRSSSSCE